MVKSGWFDKCFEVFGVEVEIIVDLRILFEKSSRHLIDLFVGALCGQNDREKKLPVRLVVKRYGGARIGAAKAGKNFSCPLIDRACTLFLRIHPFHSIGQEVY